MSGKINKIKRGRKWVQVQILWETKSKLIDLLEKRNRGVEKQSLSGLINDLANHECSTK